MDQNIQKPSIRFKGFTDAWEQCKFKDLFVKLQNNSLSRADLNDENGYAMNVHYGDVLIKFNEILDVNNENIPYITEPGIIEKYKSSFLQNGDIIIADAAEDNTVGKCCEIAGLSHEIVLAGLHTIPCRPSKNFASGYLGYYMNSNVYHDQLLPLIQGSKISSISINTLANTSLVYPKSIEEQLLLANKFRALDSLITLHQRKYDKLVNTKKALLDKMFPKNGELLPKIRFKGFTDAWEQRELGQLISKGGSGGTPTSTNPNYYNGSIPFLSITDITNSNGYIYNTEKSITELGLNNSAAWLVPKEAISLAMYASVGKVAILKENVATSQAFYNLVIDDLSTRDYIFHFLKKMDMNRAWDSLISTGTQANLNAEKVKKLTITIPTNIDEQSRLGILFNSIDSLITLHQRKYEKLKNIKKALLQKMFV